MAYRTELIINDTTTKAMTMIKMIHMILLSDFVLGEACLLNPFPQRRQNNASLGISAPQNWHFIPFPLQLKYHRQEIRLFPELFIQAGSIFPEKPNSDGQRDKSINCYQNSNNRLVRNYGKTN